MKTHLEKLDQVLEQMGHTHSPDDILGMIEAGAMQSFSDGETWIVTQIADFPQKRVLEVFMVVGTLEGLAKLEPEVERYAQRIGATMLRAFGREGWRREALHYGWRSGVRVFSKELRDGR